MADGSVAQEVTFAAQWLLILGKKPGLYQNPAGWGDNLPKILERLMPHVQYEGMVEDERPETYVQSYGNERLNFDVYVTPIEVWLDISGNPPGVGGSAVYAGIGSFAHGSKRRFVGDPEGLSELALRRRTDAMLSSAIKHGTTDHLAPHTYQVDGNMQLGVPPIDWVDGQTLHNVQAMIHTGIESLAHYVPEMRDACYNFTTYSFQGPNGGPLLDGTLEDWSNKLAGSGKARGGHATFKRNILLRSLVQSESSERPLLLEQVLRQPDQFLSNDALDGIFY
ncbi:hypothetical protein [Pseudomonas qingdaonensis]|uniref:hypothetical protein n=1 Tax=Pseudomonas qingdaonensis TaxID=2056231 RepID=UPI0036AAFE8E